MTLDPNFPVKPTGHSADVEMLLHLNGTTWPVLQSGPTAIKLKDTRGLALGDAVLEIIIDGRVHRHEIRIVSASPDTPWVTVSDR